MFFFYFNVSEAKLCYVLFVYSCVRRADVLSLIIIIKLFYTDDTCLSSYIPVGNEHMVKCRRGVVRTPLRISPPIDREYCGERVSNRAGGSNGGIK